MVLKAQVLYNVAIKRQHVESFSLLEDADRLYKAIKLEGIKETTVKYTDESGNEVSKTGDEIPAQMRAMAAAIETLVYRWPEKDEERLRKHFALNSPIVDILNIHNCYGRGNDMLPCITVKQLMEAYIGVK